MKNKRGIDVDVLRPAYLETLKRQLSEGKIHVRETHDANGKLTGSVVTRILEFEPRMWDKFFPPPLFSEAALATIMSNLFDELDAQNPPNKAELETFLRSFGTKYEEELSKRGLPLQLPLFDELTIEE